MFYVRQDKRFYFRTKFIKKRSLCGLTIGILGTGAIGSQSRFLIQPVVLKLKKCRAKIKLILFKIRGKSDYNFF